jgi:rubrerythrin
MSKTMDNLKEAFAGESQANRRYLAFAKQAEKDSYPHLARLFRAVAAAETVHAHNHLRILGGIGSTLENLKDGIEGESYEIDSMYPGFIAEAGAEGEKRALNSFKWAWEVEKEHQMLFQQALVEMGAEIAGLDIWVCPVCGSTHIGVRPEKCPVCGTPGERFERIE